MTSKARFPAFVFLAAAAACPAAAAPDFAPAVKADYDRTIAEVRKLVDAVEMDAG